MKRTEKIEVRVSLEEKQTLTQLAKQDGESVSGLIRGLVEKYMALNTASTTRKLPKWQIAAGLIVAVFIGHALTLIPIHLHERGHKSAKAALPVYIVHGAIDNSAFGINVDAHDVEKEFTLNSQGDNPIEIKLTFTPSSNKEDGGVLQVSICETGIENLCKNAFETKMDIDRVAPSVLGNSLASGKPVHIFVQEMA
ncbi:MAG: hypothetical protein ABJO36_03795 [Litorimonas sp.]